MNDWSESLAATHTLEELENMRDNTKAAMEDGFPGLVVLLEAIEGAIKIAEAK